MWSGRQRSTSTINLTSTKHISSSANAAQDPLARLGQLFVRLNLYPETLPGFVPLEVFQHHVGFQLSTVSFRSVDSHYLLLHCILTQHSTFIICPVLGTL